MRKTHSKLLSPVVQKYSYLHTAPFKRLQLCQFHEFKQILLHRRSRKHMLRENVKKKRNLLFQARLPEYPPEGHQIFSASTDFADTIQLCTIEIGIKFLRKKKRKNVV